MTGRSTFNLIDEPWIRVRKLDGRIDELPIRTTLRSAAQISTLAGEIPTQDAAIIRMLLAVMLGATRPSFDRSVSEALDLFETWWSDDDLPMAPIDEYLDRVHDRFDLVHPLAPFYQVAGLSTASGKRSGLGKLIADLPANLPFFTTRGGRAIERLSLAEAARWLVHCQAFDPSGIKTGAVGDDRVKGGRGYPFGYPAWAGNLGLVIAEGDSLSRTLLLNLPLKAAKSGDMPIWERELLGPGVSLDHSAPTGPADLFTWPSRRLRLFVDRDDVIDVQISNGDKLGPQNLHPYEPMSAWRYSKTQSKAGLDVLMPVTHDPSQRVWQGLEGLLQRSTADGGRRPPAIEWLEDLRQAGVLPPDLVISVRVIGLQYGTQNSVIVGSADDALSATVRALTDPALVQAAVDAAAQAKQGAVALANLAGDLDRAAGGEGRARERTFELGYSVLDSPFRSWVRSLRNPEQIPEARAQWARAASRLLLNAGDNLIADAGRPALVGKWVKDKLLDAGQAHRWFVSAIAKAFPDATTVNREVTP